MESILIKIRYSQQTLQALNLEAKEVIIKIINEIADSHKINRIDNKCFIVRTSEIIGKPWSPSYFDWKEGGKVLLKKLDDIFLKHREEPISEFVYFLNELLNQKDLSQKGICSIYTKQGAIPVNAEMVKAIIAKINE